MKTTEAAGVCGYDAGKKIKGRKRHIVVDTIGLMVGLVVLSEGLPSVAMSAPYSVDCSAITCQLIDGGYAEQKLRGALSIAGDWHIEIVRRSDIAKDFEVSPRLWAVERTFAWLGRCRRLAKNWERSIASSQAWDTIAHIRMLTRRATKYCYV